VTRWVCHKNCFFFAWHNFANDPFKVLKNSSIPEKNQDIYRNFKLMKKKVHSSRKIHLLQNRITNEFRLLFICHKHCQHDESMHLMSFESLFPLSFYFLACFYFMIIAEIYSEIENKSSKNEAWKRKFVFAKQLAFVFLFPFKLPLLLLLRFWH